MPKVLRHNPTPQEIAVAEEAALRRLPARDLWAILDALASRSGIALSPEAAQTLNVARQIKARVAEVRSR